VSNGDLGSFFFAFFIHLYFCSIGLAYNRCLASFFVFF
jgi:hypothetical protein